MDNNNSNIKTKKPGKTTAFFICIVVAAFLWLVRVLNTTYTYQLKIPVEFINLPENKKPLQSLPDRLDVEIKASGLKIILILASKPFKTLLIDFNELKTSNKKLSYILSSGLLNLKPSTRFEAKINQISPDTLYFTEKSGFHKTVPVKPLLNISCAQGYSCMKPEFSPAFINIAGDSNLIRSVDTLYTQTIHLTNVSGSVHRQLDIVKPSKDVYLDNTSIDLKVQVGLLSEQSIEVPVSFSSEGFKSVHIFPSKVIVKYTSLAETKKDIDPSMFKATIDLKNGGTNSKAPVILSTVPGEVNVISISPPEVEYLIIRK